MQTFPSVSVIIPNYNHALYLEQRIESVLNQTYQNFELIILDDMSTDKSIDIIENYRTNLKVSQIVYNQVNSGSVFAQWIKGIELSRGDYIWIAESDDFASTFFLEETVCSLSSDNSIGMVFTNSNAVNNIGEFITSSSVSKIESFDKLEKYSNTIHKANASIFLVSEMIIENASSVLFRKSSLLNVDFNELKKFFNTGDRFVYLSIAFQSKILYLPSTLNYMRSHGANTTKKGFENGNIHKDRLRVLNYYFNEIYNSSEEINNVLRFYVSNYLSFIHYGGFKDNYELLKKIRYRKKISRKFFFLVKGYLFFFKKFNLKLRILKGLYYRLLVKFNKY